ncbi:hypothetical protein SD71_09115 [Cohnella kolymensis]|uniref:ATPase n=1 Tax=Cohnella kolymensis TaxID=1590652 RepID=A0ABR5A5V7_9BACL|nr:hypothetical protein [Cohnella kolymensis]KIL36128.1 hypothetical protein SD71_09115 [Cohnella kolymensis]
MSFNSEAWIQFLQDRWLIVAVAIVAIFVIMNLVKTVLKWVLVIAIIIGIVAYAGYSIDDIQALGTKVSEVSDAAAQEAKDQAIKAMAGEASQAVYVNNPDGSYSITTTNLALTGIPNSGEVTVKFRGISLGTWDMEGAVRDFVLQARASKK